MPQSLEAACAASSSLTERIPDPRPLIGCGRLQNVSSSHARVPAAHAPIGRARSAHPDHVPGPHHCWFHWHPVLLPPRRPARCRWCGQGSIPHRPLRFFVSIKRYGTKRIIDAVWNIHCELEAKAKAVRGRQKKKTLDAWAVVERTRIPVVLASRCARRGTRTARAHPSPRGAEEQEHERRSVDSFADGETVKSRVRLRATSCASRRDERQGYRPTQSGAPRLARRARVLNRLSRASAAEVEAAAPKNEENEENDEDRIGVH
jgi:hypothetical protein